jgi:predicted RNA binding protein YcfA (HicA-like mRNA interferase family)
MPPKLPQVSGDELLRALKRLGFVEQRQRGSHVHLKRLSDNRRLTVPVHKGRTIPPGTLRAILRDAELSVEDLTANL